MGVYNLNLTAWSKRATNNASGVTSRYYYEEFRLTFAAVLIKSFCIGRFFHTISSSCVTQNHSIVLGSQDTIFFGKGRYNFSRSGIKLAHITCLKPAFPLGEFFFARTRNKRMHVCPLEICDHGLLVHIHQNITRGHEYTIQFFIIRAFMYERSS